MLTNLYSNTPALQRILPLHVCTMGRFNNALEQSVFVAGGFGASYSAIGWPATNRAIYSPLHLPAPFTVARFMTANNNATGNMDIGLYNNAGTRLLSTGTIARSGTSGAIQYANVTDQRFPAGHYYLGLVISTASGQVMKANINDDYQGRVCGILQEDLGSTVLPATMTPVSYTSAFIVLYGFTQSDSL